jgi:hypothetical protein
MIFSTLLFAREPNYTVEKSNDGRSIITVQTDEDALILLNEYNLPNRFYLLVLVRDIYFERVELSDIFRRTTELIGNVTFPLKGTKLTNPKDYGYERGLTIINTNNYNVKRNNPYYILFDVEKSEMLGIIMYASNLLGVMDINLNPIDRL